MAKGQKRKKQPNYVGSKGDLARQQEEYSRTHPNANRKTVIFEDAGLFVYGIFFLWCIFLMLDLYVLNNLALLYPATVLALCLMGLFHMSGPHRWIKSRRLRRPAMSLLFLLAVAALTLLVIMCTRGIRIPFFSAQ